jgi:hypothetical protein
MIIFCSAQEAGWTMQADSQEEVAHIHQALDSDESLQSVILGHHTLGEEVQAVD